MPTTKFEPGKSGNPAGRKPGVPNKLTATVRSVFEATFNEMQETGKPYSLPEWGKKNPKDFYQLASKLIPVQVSAQVEDVTPYSDTQAAAKLASLLATAQSRRDAAQNPAEDIEDLA